MKDLKKRVLVVISEFGYWGEELVGPLETLDSAKYQLDFVTPTGLRPIAIPVSYNPSFVDPPLGKPVVSQIMAEKVKALEDPENTRLANPINLNAWFPIEPYESSANYLMEKESYYNSLADRKNEIKDKYDAILIVGGSGPMIDLANNPRVHDLVRCFYELGKPIAAECYGVTCLAFTEISPGNDNHPVIWGKHVTGHPHPHDYNEGTAVWDRTTNSYFTTRFATIKLQMLLTNAVGPDGGFYGNVGRGISALVDYPFITGRSTPDSYMTGQKLIEVLENDLVRYGW